MKCPKCQAENPEAGKFCRECGAKILRLCPRCLSESQPGDKFCGECGLSLTLPRESPAQELSFAEKLQKIQRYLPRGLTEKVLAQRGKIEGERKQVTVLFCDMEGFTPLVESLGAEEAYAVMDQVYEILMHKVHDYGGTVNEMTGDGIMALFGAPIALEDAPQRAIRSAYAIHREMVEFSDRLKQERGIQPIRMRVGIHTGPVVVGTLGDDLRVEFKAVGETVNLASRMEGLAEPGTTYITEDTFILAEGHFRFEALGEKKVKGMEKPAKVYQVIAPRIRRARFDVSAERGLTPFIGRERELELLLDGFERVKGGRGQAFSIMGEAGVGKSRLLYEFRKAVANEDITMAEGQCLSYSQSVSYLPFIDILKSYFELQEDHRDSEVREKVKRNLKVLGVEEAFTLPYFLEFLAVEDSGMERIRISPEGKKGQIIEAFKRVVLKGSGIRPLIMVVEDLHWIDKSSEELLKHLLDSIPGSRVFLIFTYRPEFVTAWGSKSYHNQLTLNRMSNRESLAMVAHLLGTDNIDRNLEELILERTEGIPFFVEEFVKSLNALKIIEKKSGHFALRKGLQSLSIPSSIQDVIMARVDSLPEATRDVLQCGSVIEREFEYALLKEVMDLPERELLSQLHALTESELLYERGIFPQSTYIFKHSLTREVVYGSILARKQRKLHEQIGRTMEKIYGDKIDEHYPVLAEHFIASEHYERGAHYARLAAKKAEKLISFTDAIAYAQKAVDCMEKMPATAENQIRLIDARTVLGVYLSQMSYIPEAKEAIDPITELAVKNNYRRRLSQIDTILGIYHYMVEENFPAAMKYLEEALQISQEVKDIFSSVFINHLLGLILSWNCEFQKSFQYMERALRVNEAEMNIWGVSVMKSSLSVYVYNYQGMVGLGHKTSYEALQLAEECGDILSKSMAYTSHGISCFYRGLLKEAENHLLQGIDYSEKISLFSHATLAHQWLGHVYYDQGEWVESRDHYEKAISLRKQSRLFPSSIRLNQIALARIKVSGGEKDVDMEGLFRYAHENRIKLHEGPMARYIGEVLLQLDDSHLDQARDWIQEAIRADNKNGLMWDLGKDWALYAEFLNRKGERSSARQNLECAQASFQKCGADGWAQRAGERMAQL